MSGNGSIGSFGSCSASSLLHDARRLFEPTGLRVRGGKQVDGCFAGRPGGGLELPDLDVEPGVAVGELVAMKKLFLVRIDVGRHDRLEVLDCRVDVSLLKCAMPATR